MMSKALFLVALLGAASAQHYSHGHATSSQSIIRHDNRHGYIHDQPIAVHAAPISYHQPAIAVHAAPVIQHMPAIRHVAPIYYHAVPVQAHGHEEHYPHQKYEFDYSVADTHTGDIKSQHEAHDGDYVTGSYSLHQRDGLVRTIHYTGDEHNGFNAQVQYSH